MDLKDPKTQRFIFLGACLFCISYMFFFSHYLPFGFQPRREKITALSLEYERLNAELEKARRTVGNLAKLEAEYTSLHDKWLAAQELLPEENRLPDLLTQVTRAGLQTGLEFDLFKPEEVRPHEFYVEHPVSVEVTGTYHQVGLFLSRIANLERILNVADLQVTALGDPRSGRAGGAHRMARARRAAGSSAPGGKKRELPRGTVTVALTLKAYTLQEGGVTGEDQQASAR
jgi:type IV pilus assembly protein PilO